jgi:hypothetical protein
MRTVLSGLLAAGLAFTAAAAPAAQTGAIRDITLPAGTRLQVVLDTSVESDSVSGVVTSATRSGKVKGLAHVAMRFDTVTPPGESERYQIRTLPVGRTAPATKKKDALEVGASAAGGAIIGALVGGEKGALIGGAAGGGAGTAVVLSTRGKEVHVPKGAALTLKLSAPLTVRVSS